jgi:hypothetical protein
MAHDTAHDKEYFCVRCGYATLHMTSMKRHLQRSTPCKATLCDLSPQEVHNGLFPKDEKKRGCVCDGCGKHFRTKYSLHYHVNAPRACRARDEVVVVPTASSSQAVSATTTNNNNNNNNNSITVNQNIYNHTQNNIVINAFGRESMDHLTRSFLDQCLRRRDKGIVELIERIHFDPMHQENCNVKATNAKLPLVKIHDGHTWKYARKDRILSDLVDKGHGIMQEHFDDHEDTIRDATSDTMFNLIKRWMDKMQEGDKKTWEGVLTDMYILILNATTNSEQDLGAR